MGAWFRFGAAKGQTLKEAGQKARRVWVDRVYKAATRRGFSRIIEEWTMFAKEEGKDILDRMGHGKGQCSTEHLPSELVPSGAKGCSGDLWADRDYERYRRASWLLVRKLYHAKNKNRSEGHRRKLEETAKLISSIENQCTLDQGLCLTTIFKCGRRQWETGSGALVIRSLEAGINRFGVVGLDSEGNGSYFQLFWMGEEGLEALVVGPRFFPDELVAILTRDDVYVLGVAVMEDVLKLGGEGQGWKTVDLSVLASDMPTNDHQRPGMAALIMESTGTDITHLKKPKKGGKFFSLRKFGWDSATLSKEKIVYAAMDAAMAFPIVFNVIIFWSNTYSQGDLYDGQECSWKVLKRILGPWIWNNG